MTEHRDGRNVVRDGRMLGAVDRLLVLAEEDHHDRYRKDRAEFDCKEHTGLALHIEEVIEVHVICCREHDRSRVADKCCGALEVRRDSDADDHGDRVDLELFADGKTYGRNHENCCDVIDECGYDT